MRTGKVQRHNFAIIERCWRTNNAFERMRGLLFRDALQPGEAMWIEPCSSIHSCGMKYELDLVFLDLSGVIRKLVRELKPWRMAWCFGAATTLELARGEIDRLGLSLNQQLLWQESS